MTFDANRNQISTTDPLGNTTSRTYDLVSRLIASTDPRGKSTRFAYDALNRLTQIVDALNGVTAFSYDGNGNLLTITDPRGSITAHTYDPLNRLQTRTDPLGRQEAYQYDPSGNLTQFTDRKGQVSTFTRDPLDRLTRSAFADGTFLEFAYDAGGRLVRATDSQTGTVLHEFDILDRLIGETTPQGTLTYAYDAGSRRTSMTVDGAAPVSYAYDAGSRLIQIGQGTQAATITYDALDRRTLLTLPNGVAAEYQYDPASRLTALLYRNAGGAVVGDLTYRYDPAGNRIAVGGSFGRTLLPEPIPAATYDAANRQVSFGGKQMLFDPNGNLTSITDQAGTTTFSWDSRDRLIGISGPNLVASFVYNAFSRRSQKVINGEAVQQFFDGPHLARTTQAGTSSHHVNGPSLDEPLLLDSSHAYLADGNGNVIALVDSSGSLVTTYNYEPFGNRVVSGAAINSPFGFTGREDDGVGLLYYRARYYDPSLARFISEDPLGIAGGLNFYAYVGNNPISYADPFGLCRDPGGPGIRYCIETFIPQDKVWGFTGDNRSPDPNGGTFRTHQEIFQTQAGITTSFFEPGISEFGPLRRPAVPGPVSWEVKDLPFGGRKIIVSGAASDGLFFSLAPDAYYRLTILETADGEAKLLPGGKATPFPSIEIYQYGGPGGGPRLIYHYDAKAAGTGPLDLFRTVPLK